MPGFAPDLQEFVPRPQGLFSPMAGIWCGFFSGAQNVYFFHFRRVWTPPGFFPPGEKIPWGPEKIPANVATQEGNKFPILKWAPKTCPKTHPKRLGNYHEKPWELREALGGTGSHGLAISAMKPQLESWTPMGAGGGFT